MRLEDEQSNGFLDWRAGWSATPTARSNDSYARVLWKLAERRSRGRHPGGLRGQARVRSCCATFLAGWIRESREAPGRST